MEISRIKKKELDSLMKQFPAVAILGSRQAGKTTLAKISALKSKGNAIYFDLEKKTDRLRFDDIEMLLEQTKDKCVIIDEAQIVPEIFTALRPNIDENNKPGRFILLGSVSPHLVKGISESLAGRIAHLELSVINAVEIKKYKIALNKLWFRGGYPKALLASNNTKWSLWCENYFKNFIERDVHLLSEEKLSSSTVDKLWRMLAGINGNVLNHDMLSRSLGISRPTVIKYLDFLEGTFLIIRLQPWFINISKRIVKAPKFYFRDSGMLHFLNDITTPEELNHNIHVGASWEGFVIEQIRQLRPRNTGMFYYRTHHGAEADLILVKGICPVACIEIKISDAPTVSRGFHEVIDDMKTDTNFIITPNAKPEIYSKKIKICSLKDFLEKELGKI